MPEPLTRFRIEALHHTRTIDIPITDNRLVLVGENGMGKSTVANLLYYFLSGQWSKMLKYDFSTISAVVDGEKITAARDQIVAQTPSFGAISNVLEREVRRYPHPLQRALESIITHYAPEEIIRQRDYLAQDISRDYSIPSSVVRNYLARLIEEIYRLSGELRETTQFLRLSLPGQVLYLPTYRRIEQDLETIFPGIEKRQRRRKTEGSAYVELVEFGMQDVETLIRRKMNDLKDNLRTSLNNLTGTYLRDIIRGDYGAADSSTLQELDDATIDDIFSRIDRSILPEREQESLRASLDDIRSGASQEDKKVVTHFLVQLIKLYDHQQENERDIEAFVKVCNRYLLNKQLDYDKSAFEISIHEQMAGSEKQLVLSNGRGELPEDEHNQDECDDSREIALDMLSSGEKQIVSLFAHIYLSGNPGYFVIMDEPELSLSVPWQKQLLPDILATGRCSGLVAATHSPFIFDNELDAYSHSLEEFIVPANVTEVVA